MKRSTLFIVTYAKDFVFLRHCLRSIEKFASRFSEVRILVPTQDQRALEALVFEVPDEGEIPIVCLAGEEWPGKGMNWHMAQIMRSDEWCPGADYISHLDSDCVFTEPVTPETFMKDGKPILQYERFDSIGRRHPGVMAWKTATENCLPFEILYETMRGHGMTLTKETYGMARKLIEQKTETPMDDYIKSCRNEYPQHFCEFVTLGNVAIHSFKEHYHLVDNSKKPNPDKSDFPVGQFWSHRSPDQPQDIWWDGVQKTIVPIEKIKELGIS